MPRPTFGSLTRSLLEAGISPRFANRLRTELADHYRDLEREAVRRGWTPAAAREDARRRLGSHEAILKSFLQHPELRTWIYRSRIVTGSLRVICSIYLLLLRVRRAPATATIARFGAASGVACVATGTLLLALEFIVTAEPQARHRTNRVAASHVAVEIPIRDDETSQSGAAKAAENEIVLVALTTDSQPAVSRPDTPQISAAATPTFRLPTIAFDPEPRVAAPGFHLEDSDYLPIVKVSPIFPFRAAARGIEGYVIVEYTVTTAGTVRDLVIVESSSYLFERSALEAAAKFRYKPRVVDGRTVAVTGVRTIIRFELDKNAHEMAPRESSSLWAALQNRTLAPPYSADPAARKPLTSSYVSSRAFSRRANTSILAVAA